MQKVLTTSWSFITCLLTFYAAYFISFTLAYRKSGPGTWDSEPGTLHLGPGTYRRDPGSLSGTRDLGPSTCYPTPGTRDPTPYM